VKRAHDEDLHGGEVPPDARAEPPAFEVLRVDPRLLEVACSLFWASFPGRRLGRGGPDRDGRVLLTTDPPWTTEERERWRSGLDRLLRQPFAAAAGAYLREVRDRAGRRDELALPVAPEAYRGGAWLVGPFRDAAAADAWAASTLLRPWLHDVHHDGPHVYADVFVGDPEA
jgi:hypothetical protein